MMNGDKIESHESVANMMAAAQERERNDSIEYQEDQDEREQQDDEQPKRSWAIIQALLLIIALGLAGYNHYLLADWELDTQSGEMVLESLDIGRGDECYEGGVKFQAGRDANANLLLDDDEITASAVLCHGIQGASGSSGLAGLDGVSPSQPLLQSTQLLPGGACPSGGATIATGMDDDKNGVLDEQEVVSQQTLCTNSRRSTS